MIVRENGQISWDKSDFAYYEVTGITTDGRRFDPMAYTTWFQAVGINVWRGTKWGVRADGTRVQLQTVWN